MLDFVSVLFFVFTGLLVWKFLQFSSSTKLPPGPIPWPLVGNLPQLIVRSRGGKGDQLLKNLNDEYGPIMMLDVGLGKLRILLFDDDLMKQAFIKKARITSSRPSSYHLINEIHGKKGILFNPDWEGPKKFVSNATNGSILGADSLEKMIQHEVLALCQEISNKGGKPFDPYHFINLCTYNMVASLMLNKRYNYNEPDGKEVLKNMGHYHRRNFAVNPINIIPQLRYLKYFFKMFDTSQVLEAYNAIKNHVRREVKEHRATFDSNNIKDLLDLYLDREKTEFKDIDENNLVCIISEMLLGGTYTTGTALRWILLFMINYPAVQLKCREEIHNLLGDTDLPELKHMKDLNYVQAAMNECMRLRGVTLANMLHAVDEEMELGGYCIPKGASIQGIMSITHMNKYAFGVDVDQYRPERWIDDDGKLKSSCHLVWVKGSVLGNHWRRKRFF